uniref:NADH dehydrogenase subunit 5 n=1 Tax=Cystoclonium purpureum f. stellatum TaxID=3024809 RepID=UPI0023F39C84|nr:NADH dehydrogenase subunit 5 [Cystoclonium purpureum f. stellatum]WDY85191.1 NADH dehydrogenase subunit 5 [Cystoclonium purpureum f. stellatum]
MYLLILLLPLLGSLVSGLGGRWLGCWGSSQISTLCILVSSILSLIAFYEVGFSGISCHIILSPWLESGNLKVNWGFLFDSISIVMLIVITFISTLVHLYSIKYMEMDPHRPRFMSYLCIFTFFMLILVTADNLLQMFLGWEGVGLASYLLINFWYTRLAANQSAIKALVINRIGDFGLSLGIITIFWVFQSIDYSIIFSTTPIFENFYFYFLFFRCHSLTLIGIFLFIGAMGKSAQLGLHTWLPDAMEGPTPVSALIHAATMVTAGVFLMIRFSPLLEFSPGILFILVIIGSLTAFFAGMTGIFQNDLKKVIAYSTCSQLGYMIFTCGLSCYDVSLFHLTNHAFFKALLFLSAGSVIHSLSNEQDMRRMGSLISFLPLTYSLMLIGSLALVGFPYLTGFYSKDFILELTQSSSYNDFNYIVFASWLGNISVFFTSFYSFRLLYLTFLNSSNINRIILNHIHESSLIMALPLILLTLGSLFIGFLFKDLFIGLGSDFWRGSIFVLPTHNFFIEAEWLPISIKWLPFILTFFGIILASLINITNFYKYFLFNRFKLSSFFVFLISKRWYLDTFYNRFIVYPLLNFGYLISYKILDRGFIELAGPFGFSKLILNWTLVISKLQTGQIIHYIFFIIGGLCFFFILIYTYSIVEFYFHLIGFFFILFFFI